MLAIQLRSRPLLVTFLGLIAGLSSGYSWVNLLWALLLIPPLWKSPKLAVYSCAILFGVLIRPDPSIRIAVPGGRIDGVFEVVSMPTSVRSRSVSVVEHDGRRYRLYQPLDSPLCLGDRITMQSAVVPLWEKAVPQHGEIAEIRPLRPIELARRGWPIWRWSLAMRRSFVSFVQETSSSHLVGLTEAMCLNVTGDLGDSLYEDLRTTGTIHIVSASGLHCAVICLALGWLLAMLPMPRWAQLGVLTVCLVFYAAAAGLNAPIVRSCIGMVVGFSAYLFRREPDPLTALSFAGLMTLVFEPAQVADTGFQLSYLAVASLTVFCHADWLTATIANKTKTGPKLWLAIKSNLVVSGVLAPLIACSFGAVSLVSVISNALILPAVPIVVAGGLSAWAVSWFPALSMGINKVLTEPAAAYILMSVETTANAPIASADVPAYSAHWLVLVYALIVLLWKPDRMPP